MRCCLGALPESAERCVGDFSSSDFTRTAWACSVASQSDALLGRGSARISRAVCGRLQLTGPHQHSRGICGGGPVGCVAVQKALPGPAERWWAASAHQTSPTQHGHLRTIGATCVSGSSWLRCDQLAILEWSVSRCDRLALLKRSVSQCDRLALLKWSVSRCDRLAIL